MEKDLTETGWILCRERLPQDGQAVIGCGKSGSSNSGEWIYGEFDIPHCSECGAEVKEISPFCPQCGAKMEEEHES